MAKKVQAYRNPINECYVSIVHKILKNSTEQKYVQTRKQYYLYVYLTDFYFLIYILSN